MRSNEAAAVAWWSRLPDSPLRTHLGNGLASSIAARGEYDRALMIFRPIPGPDAELAAATIVEAGAKRNPPSAAQWLESLPPDFDIAKAAEPLVQHWIARDSAAAAHWVEAQPAGPRRDAIVHAYARAAAGVDPSAAGEWAVTIADPKVRLIAAEYVYREMRRRDPGMAGAWLRALPGAESAWCERIIRLQL
jgi:hypothetical protein